MCIAAKLFGKLILLRLRPTLEKILRPCQNGFRPKRSITQQILALRILCDIGAEYQSAAITIAFVDFAKAFDSVKWNYLEAILRLYGIPEQLIRAIMSLYNGAQARARTQDELTFNLSKGVLQGDTSSISFRDNHGMGS